MSIGSRGRQFVVGEFSNKGGGRRIAGIFDNKGRVFLPNPYDIPEDPYKVALFAAHMLEMMLDTKLISYEYFERGETDWYQFKERIMDLRNNIPFFSKIRMERQPPPSIFSEDEDAAAELCYYGA
jgi:hypothetical protein